MELEKKKEMINKLKKMQWIKEWVEEEDKLENGQDQTINNSNLLKDEFVNVMLDKDLVEAVDNISKVFEEIINDDEFKNSSIEEKRNVVLMYIVNDFIEKLSWEE